MPTKYVNEGHWCTCFVMLVSIKVELVLEFDDILTGCSLAVVEYSQLQYAINGCNQIFITAF